MTVEGQPRKLRPQQQQRMLVPLLEPGACRYSAAAHGRYLDDQLPKERARISGTLRTTCVSA